MGLLRRFKEDDEDLHRAKSMPSKQRELDLDALRGRPTSTSPRGRAPRPELPRRRAPGGLSQRHVPVERGPPVQRRARPLAGRDRRRRLPRGAGSSSPRSAGLVLRPGGEAAARAVGPTDVAVARARPGRDPATASADARNWFKVPVHVSRTPGSRTFRRSPACTWRGSVERYTERGDGSSGSGARAPLDDLELSEHWIVAVRKHSDDAVGRAAHRRSGPRDPLHRAGCRLRAARRVGSGRRLTAGLPRARRRARCDSCADGRAVRPRRRARSASPETAPERPLDEKLLSPEWLQFVADRLDEAHTLWPVGARLERVVQIAVDRGLAVEDPRAFHQLVPARCNVPGEAFGVLRGAAAGHRADRPPLVLRRAADGPPRRVPEDSSRIPGGSVGCDVAVVAVDPTAPSTLPEGAVEDDLRFAVDDGVLTAWRTRPRWQADGEALDRLSADVAAVVGAARPQPIADRLNCPHRATAVSRRREERHHPEAERRLGGRVAHPPDVVQARAAVGRASP